MSMPKKTLLIPLVFGALVSSAVTQAAPVNFENGRQIVTTGGELMHAHGGGLLQVGNTYYMLGENRAPDGEGKLFGAVSMYRSTDLVNWTHANDILTRYSNPDLNPANIERPKVIYNAAYDHYVMWAHKENGTNYSDAEIAVAVSDTVDGDYVYQGSFRPLGYQSRDQTVFVDTDGTGYLISSARSNYDLHIYRLSDDYLRVEQRLYVFEGDHREAPAVFERNGTYFMVTSGASGWNANQQKYATTTNFPEGPWSSWKNVGNSKGYRSQTTYVATVSGWQGTSYMYMGDRWGPQWGGTPNDSHYVWLPLEFPSSNTLSMDWFPNLTIDTDAGVVQGVNQDRTTIMSRNSGRCIDVSSESVEDNANILQWACHGGYNQEWVLEPTSGGYYKLVAWHSGKCMTVDGTANGSRAFQRGCSATLAGQEWKPVSAGGGYYELVSRQSGRCLDVNGQSKDNGAKLQLWSCWGGSNQQWDLMVP